MKLPPAPATPPRWSYSGERGPARWAGLDPAYALAACGTCQSPIELEPAQDAGASPLDLAYRPVRIFMQNDGRTIRAFVEPGCSMTLEGVAHDLFEFHFHEPGEHTIAGARAPLEAHFVHRDRTGDLAVVAVFFKIGQHPAPVLDELWAAAPETVGGPDPARPGPMVDLRQLLPAGGVEYAYDGSLTTPPCTEGVRWLVLADALAATQAQIDGYRAFQRGNARPLQDRGDRKVQRFSATPTY